MNAVTNVELDDFSQRCVLLVKGLHDLTILLPAYQAVADPLSYTAAAQVIEALRLESKHLHYDELTSFTERVMRLAVSLRQAVAEWLVERD
jgi:hypothetical protein